MMISWKERAYRKGSNDLQSEISNDLQSEITEKEIEEISKAMVEDFFLKFFSNLFLKPIRIGKRQKEELAEELPKAIKDLIKSIKEIEKIESRSDISQEEKISLIYPLIDKIIHRADSSIPEDVHAMDYYIEWLKLALQIPSDLDYLKNTKYYEYKVAVEKILQEGFRMRRQDLMRAFLEDVDNSDDAFALAQGALPLFIKHYRYLQKGQKYVGKRQIDKYMNIYGELSGYYEKLLSIVVGLLDILEKGEKSEYLGVRKEGLHSNIKKVERIKDYKILVENFSKTIRNAIAHNTYSFDIIDKKIDFIDFNKRITLSYRDFINQTKELSSLVYVLFQIRLLFVYYQLTSVQKYLSRL